MEDQKQTKAVQRPFKKLIEDIKVKARFERMLGDNATAFLMSVLNCVNNNEKLQLCDPQSVLMAAAVAGTLGLPIDPNLGQAFIIPYKIQGVMKAQFQIGYKGLIQLGHRAQQFKGLNTTEVREGEYKSVNRLTGKHYFEWIQDDDEREKLTIEGFVAYFELVNGFTKSMYMTTKKMKWHGAKYSKTFTNQSGRWVIDYVGMGKKTVLKLLIDKYAPKSVDMQKAITSDQGIFDTDGSMKYADNPTNDVVDLEEHNAEKERQRGITFIVSAKDINTLEKVYEHIPDEDVRKLYDKKHKELTKLENKK